MKDEYEDKATKIIDNDTSHMKEKMYEASKMISKEELIKNYKEKGYTATQVAKILNISRRSLYNMFNGKMSQDKRDNYTKIILSLIPLYNTNFINQPTLLDSDVEEAILYLEAFASIEEKNNFYRDIDDMPQWDTIKRTLTNNRKDIDMLIRRKNILLGENKELQSKLNAIEEVVDINCMFPNQILYQIKQILKGEPNETRKSKS